MSRRRIEDGCLKNRTLPGRLTLNGSVYTGILIDDNVAIFGGKEVLTFSLPSEDDRSTQKEYANNISIKNRKRGAKHNDSRSF